LKNTTERQQKNDNEERTNDNSLLLETQFYAEAEETQENYIEKDSVYKASEILRSQDLKVCLLTFHEGARTRLYYHESEQILLGHEGEAFVRQ
jgi:hypothetical protein